MLGTKFTTLFVACVAIDWEFKQTFFSSDEDAFMACAPVAPGRFSIEALEYNSVEVWVLRLGSNRYAFRRSLDADGDMIILVTDSWESRRWRALCGWANCG